MFNCFGISIWNFTQYKYYIYTQLTACLKLIKCFLCSLLYFMPPLLTLLQSKGMTREGTVRSPSAMSNASQTGTSVQVRLRQPGMQRKPRPTSIHVSGMSQSMYDKKTPSAASTPSSFRGPPRCEIPNFYKLCRIVI